MCFETTEVGCLNILEARFTKLEGSVEFAFFLRDFREILLHACLLSSDGVS